MSSETPGTSLFEHADDAVTYTAGTTIFNMGDPGDTLFVVQDGEVDIIVNGVTVETVGPKGMFGEMSLLDGEPRSSTAVARTDAKVVAVNQTRFMFMLRQTPFFAIQVMRMLVHRLRATDQLIKAG